MVYENASRWFAEDGQLTKRICEDTSLSVPDCCACDDAKYRVNLNTYIYNCNILLVQRNDSYFVVGGVRRFMVTADTSERFPKAGSLANPLL